MSESNDSLPLPETRREELSEFQDEPPARERKLTEKGTVYKVAILKQKRQEAYLILSRQIEKIRQLLSERVGLETLELERDHVDNLKDTLNVVHRELDDVIDEEDKQSSYQWFDIRDREFTEFRAKFTEKIHSLERESKSISERSYKSKDSDPLTVKTRKSRESKVSSQRSMKSAASLKLEAATKAAKLKIDLDFLERENEARRIKLMKELAIAKAEEEIIYQVLNEAEQSSDEIIESESLTEKLPSPEPPVVIFTPKPTAVEMSTPPNVSRVNEMPVQHSMSGLNETVLQQLIHLQENQTKLSSMMLEQQRVSSLPTKEPPVFNGNYFDFPIFITAFETIIESRVSDSRSKLYYLDKYTSGKANDLIKGFITVNSDDGFEKAKALLTERFGDPYRVSDSYKSDLMNWPRINDCDNSGLQAFADFLVRCEEAMNSVKFMDELNSGEFLKKLAGKLPNHACIRWCRHAHGIKKSSLEMPKFNDFVKFVKVEADIAVDPIFSPDVIKAERKKAQSPQGISDKKPPHPKVNSFAASVNPPSDVHAVPMGPKQQPPKAPRDVALPQCLFCEKEHWIESCYQFREKSEDERRAFVMTKRLCFRCLRVGHVSSKCNRKVTCKECGNQHPTALHGVKPKRKTSPGRVPGGDTSSGIPESTSAETNVCDSKNQREEVISSLILPVEVHHISNPDVKVNTYAFLDDGSDSTFVKSSVLEDLGRSGTETTLKLNTVFGRSEVRVQRVEGLVVQGLDGGLIELPKVFSRESIPSRKNQIPTSETALKWPHLAKIKEKIPPLREDIEIGLLIGCNCPKALQPREVLLGGDNDPYAVRTLLGWGIIGPVSPSQECPTESEFEYPICNRIQTEEIGSSFPKVKNKFVVDMQTKEIVNPSDVKEMFEMDFSELCDGHPYSQHDRKFLEIVEKGIRHLDDSHYEMPLPLKDESVVLPNNRAMAYHRLKPLKKRLLSDEKYRDHYVEFMNKMIQNGYAEEVPSQKPLPEEKRSVWYIPHHGVYHPKKPNKIRVVFDCSAEYQGESLNKNLLQGPDLTNNMTGVLHRFRHEPVAVICDIEAMFYQVKVRENCRDLLRFLWWEKGDVSKEPKEYRMTVHLFGAASSPGCSNFALKATADDHEDVFGSAAADFLRHNFYVDDGLKSVPTEEEAVDLVRNVKAMCSRGGFNLNKFNANNKNVIKKIPIQDRAEDVKQFNIDTETLPTERALGIQWCIESDSFKFTIALKDRPYTRRGILSTVSSIFDPLGFVAPVVLEGKAILQELCSKSVGWDEPVSEEITARWVKWKTDLVKLNTLSIPRCYKPKEFGTVVKAELHHFSDASFKGYGQCSYLRQTNKDGKIHCSLVSGKARVTPLKKVTIPRLELTAAVLSVRVSQQLKRELDVNITDEVFWTDSQVVLGYIANQTKRFHMFVANRIQEIQEKTAASQWRYVDTKSNPADYASRGLAPGDLKQSMWLRGPGFLWKEETEWNKTEIQCDEVLENDPEVKKVVVLATEVSQSWPTLVERLKYFSSWFRAKRAVALCRRYIKKLKLKSSQKSQNEMFATAGPSVQELSEAEMVILKTVQEEAFEEEVQFLKSLRNRVPTDRETLKLRNKNMKKTSCLYRLDPFIDEDGILRVGGRIKKANIPYPTKFPVILPRKNHVTSLIIKHYHEQVKHQGRGITQNEIRASGFWIMGGASVVRDQISTCVTCRKVRGNYLDQKMADLPEDRLEPAPPFTNCGVDYFGPWYIKMRRSELKRYGVIFTCMASRAVHIEVADTMDTDSFINATRRFICRRGPIRQLRSDRGSNIVGAKNELKQALSEFDHAKIQRELLNYNCDWYEFKMNVPHASHMGGTWERQIRTIRSVLSALLLEHGTQLDDESLRTLMCETEAIINSRPLTVEDINDPHSWNPLTPNHLLTMKTKVVLPPPGEFQSADRYSRKRWRRVQHLANEFWTRWKKEFLLAQQKRQKWSRDRRNLQVGDIVILGDDTPRNQWRLAKIMKTNCSQDGRVRSATVKVAERTPNKNGPAQTSYLERPIQKMVLLVPTEDQG